MDMKGLLTLILPRSKGFNIVHAFGDLACCLCVFVCPRSYYGMHGFACDCTSLPRNLFW